MRRKREIQAKIKKPMPNEAKNLPQKLLIIDSSIYDNSYFVLISIILNPFASEILTTLQKYRSLFSVTWGCIVP